MRMGPDTWDKRRRRQDLVPLANPQCGVAALAGAFGRETTPVPGVDDISEARALPEGRGVRR
jgi:hypothetical protein